MTTPTPFKVISKGLYNPAANGMKSFEQWQQDGGTDFKSIAPDQINDSVVDKVNEITAADSPMMKMAETAGKQAANQRGLLNSSHAAGAMRDAVLSYAMPLASQEASQAATKNINARNFEYTMAAKDLDAGLQERIAQMNLDSSDRNAAAQFLTNMEAMYNDRYAQIMANTSLSSSQRTTFLNDAKALRDKELNFVEQLYNVEIDW